MAPDLSAVSPTPGKEKPPVPKGKGNIFQNVPAAVAGFLLEVTLPTIVALVLLYLLSGSVNLWSLDRNMALIIAIVFLVIVCLLLSYAIDAFLRGVRRGPPLTGKKRAAQYRLRLIKYILGGLLLPLGVMAAANFSQLPGGGSLMDYYIRTIQTRLTTTPTSEIGNAILASSNPTTKIQGLKALEAIHTTEALDELIRVMNADPNFLKDAGQYQALSKAIAVYGVDAKLKLLDIFGRLPPEESNPSTLGGEDLFGRYFALPVAVLEDEINGQSIPATTRQTQADTLNNLVSTMKASLEEIQAQGESTGHSTQDFILDTLMQMDMKNDGDLRNFGKLTAANPAYSDEIRGKAILLISRFGEKVDMGLLYPYLENSDDYLKAKALEGITNLQSKVNNSITPTPAP